MADFDYLAINSLCSFYSFIPRRQTTSLILKFKRDISERSEWVCCFSRYPQGVSRIVKRAGLGLFIFIEAVVSSGLFYLVTWGGDKPHLKDRVGVLRNGSGYGSSEPHVCVADCRC